MRMDYSTLPEYLRVTLSQINADDRLNEGITAMRARMRDRLQADLVGAAIVPEARAILERAMRAHWEVERAKNAGMASATKAEVVIGGGYHAAVYCAVRHAMGGEPPLVIEENDAPGGNSFGCTLKPSFWANSRNRAGDANVPGEDGGLNTIPGALVQPSMLSSAEFQSNADIAFCIRLALAMYGKVAVGKRAVAANQTNGDIGPSARTTITVEGDERRADIRARRLIVATGPGKERKPGNANEHVLTFTEFMQRMTRRFPLEGIRRVAVIGSGDGGKCAIEALFGMGPAEHWSVAHLDQIERCDWYCQLPNTCEAFRDTTRTRYKRISALLPNQNRGVNGRSRLNIITSNSSAVGTTYGAATVDGRRYDLVVYCGGYEPIRGGNRGAIVVGGRAVAVRTAFSGAQTYAVGPAAGLDWDETDAGKPWQALNENKIAMWRLGPFTAALAATPNPLA
jgi:hypothetical protein